MSKDDGPWPDQEYLQGVAKQVGELFPPESRQRQWLVDQIRRAVEQQTAHDEHEGEQAQHYRNLEKTPRWRDQEAGPPKGHPDWKWSSWALPAGCFTAEEVRDAGPTDRSSGLTPEQAKVLNGWGPPGLLDDSGIPPEPIHWLYPFGDPDRPPQEVLPAQCFILACVHDIARRGKGFRLLLEGIDLPTALSVCVDHQRFDGDGLRMTGFDREGIDCALEAVREGLPRAEGSEEKPELMADGLARGGPDKRKTTKRRKPGRPPLAKDKAKLGQYRKWAAEWHTGKYKTYADCAATFGSSVSADDIRRACEYARKHPRFLQRRRSG